MIKIIPALPVIKIQKAVDFYQDKLGFHCVHKAEDFAILQRDKVELHLWAAFDKSWKWRSIFLFLRPIWSGAESFLAGTHSCRIEVEAIDQLYREYKNSGVLYHNTKTVIEETPWGSREFAVLDLHRNLLTFTEPK